ncbi:Hypothetical_protein [Hexamita inflata]|uniref:Hypothetical_protein n=1 Tax=Hexamita inflata TaxID=28002 RepID=A0AA86UMU2_9EUKA|nr:Hypothetical protein HINF_LOCUS45272 [Hexamita inflata]
MQSYLNVSAFEAEQRLQSLLFLKSDYIIQFVKRYTTIKISASKQHHCFFKQINKSRAIISLKNNFCSRVCGIPTVLSCSSIIKNWSDYEKKFMYITNNLNLITFNKQNIKTLFSNEQKFYFVRFSGTQFRFPKPL